MASDDDMRAATVALAEEPNPEALLAQADKIALLAAPLLAAIIRNRQTTRGSDLGALPIEDVIRVARQLRSASISAAIGRPQP